MDSRVIFGWVNDVYSTPQDPGPIVWPPSPETRGRCLQRLQWQRQQQSRPSAEARPRPGTTHYHNQTGRMMPRDSAHKSLRLDDAKSIINEIDYHPEPQKDNNRSSGSNYDVKEDLLATPRPPPSSTNSTSRSKSMFSTLGGSSISLPRPQSPTRHSQSTHSTHTRSRSPIKQLFDLVKLKKPVLWEDFSTSQLRVRMENYNSRALLDSIYEALQIGYLPMELKDILSKETLFGIPIDILYAKRPPRPINALQLQQASFLVGTISGSSHPPVRHDEPSKVGEYLPNFIHVQSLLSELEILRAIVAASKDHDTIPRTEASWNEYVHGPMLNLAVQDIPGVRVENVTRANIAKEFLPPTSIEHMSLPPDSKLIDYAMVLQPLNAEASARDVRGGNGLINRRMDSFVAQLEYLSFNQSPYPPLCTMPSGIFIGTKAGINSIEAKTQLGMWLASWYGRVSRFPCINDSVLPPPILPVLIVEATLWRLYFAFDMGSHYDVCGPINIGGTEDLHAAYRLLAVLRILAQWMKTDFSNWVENCLQQAGV
ncbi:hypothetical protein GGR51DRAFT_571946 [Nemania sp. FL0031]|nr:hypothetical protein GGR51DRAFT_571946 [Nemania sp. FL0031]